MLYVMSFPAVSALSVSITCKLQVPLMYLPVITVIVHTIPTALNCDR